MDHKKTHLKKKTFPGSKSGTLNYEMQKMAMALGCHKQAFPKGLYSYWKKISWINI